MTIYVEDTLSLLCIFDFTYETMVATMNEYTLKDREKQDLLHTEDVFLDLLNQLKII